MTMPSQGWRGFGNNVAGAIQGAQERSAIDDILSQANQSEDPNAVNNAIGQILQRVSPERQQAALQVLQGKQQQLKSSQQRRALQEQGIDPSIADLDPALQKELIKNKNAPDSHNKSLQLINRAREIAKTGHLGPKIGILGTGRKFGSTVSSEGQRLRAEYQQIGKALVQAAAPLKITNRSEFEHYAADLEDPKRTLEEIQGTLDALEQIIKNSQDGTATQQNYVNQKAQATDQTQKQAARPALDSFYR